VNGKLEISLHGDAVPCLYAALPDTLCLENAGNIKLEKRVSHWGFNVSYGPEGKSWILKHQHVMQANKDLFKVVLVLSTSLPAK